MLLAAIAIAPGCKRDGGEKPAAALDTAAAAIPTVKFGKVTARALPQTLEVSGTLAANETSEVATQVAGLVLKVEVDVGSRVKQGDPLVVLDGRNAQLQAAAAGAAVDQARAKLAIKPGDKVDPEQVPEVHAAKEAMQLAKDNADRVKKLFDQGAVPQATWDEARTHAETASAQYDAAVNGVRATAAALNSAQAQAGLASKALTDTTVRAPFDGAVAEKRISVGEFANPGRVVAVVVSDNPLRLRIDVAESDIAHVEVGKEVRVKVAAYPDQSFTGVVKRIGASLKAASRALPVEAEIDNTEGKLRPGLFAQGQLTLTGESRSAILVPESAVGNTGTSSRVFVLSGNRVTEKLVKTGRRVDDLVEVIGPVAEGEQVAIDSVDKLSDGAEVAPAP